MDSIDYISFLVSTSEKKLYEICRIIESIMLIPESL